MIKAFWCDDGGATLIEYALIIVIIVIVCIVAITSIGISVEQKFEPVNQELS